jgi:hypothetical protein
MWEAGTLAGHDARSLEIQVLNVTAKCVPVIFGSEKI